jgi:tripartite ATP-independent transporter DctM subunit
VDAFLDSILIVFLVGEMLIIFTDVLARSLFHSSVLWGEEIAQLALTVVAFLGGAVAYPRGHHMAVQALVARLPELGRRISQALVDWLVLVLAVVVAALSYPVLLTRWADRTLILGMSRAWYVLPLLGGMALLAGLAAWRLWWQPRKIVAASGAMVFAILFAVVVGRRVWGPWDQSMFPLCLTLTVFVVLLALSVPIGFVLPLSALLYLYTSGVAPLYSVPINMQGGIASFVLVAIPFFILAGYIMTEGGMSRPLAEFVQCLVGHFRGGLLQVIVITMYIFSGISGSKMADIAAVGASMRDTLREEGYAPAEIVSVLAASAVMGETVPPSIAMLVLGSITTLSVGALFLAGLLPAVVIALCLMALIYARAHLGGFGKKPRAPWRMQRRAAVRAMPALLVPLVLVGGILTGVATPTEVSAFAVAYALVLSAILYRNLRGTDLRRILAETAAMSGMLLFIIGTATTFSWTLTMANLPQLISQLLGLAGGSRALFLLGSMLCLVLVGALLEGLPALLVFAPLLLPVAAQLGIQPLHYGILLILAMGIGHFSPPIGVGLYVTCAVGNASVEETIPRYLPYMLVLAIGLLLVAFVPWFSLVIPHSLNLGH